MFFYHVILKEYCFFEVDVADITLVFLSHSEVCGMLTYALKFDVKPGKKAVRDMLGQVTSLK